MLLYLVFFENSIRVKSYVFQRSSFLYPAYLCRPSAGKTCDDRAINVRLTAERLPGTGGDAERGMWKTIERRM
nr:MAG TPA: hypothetical protein [Caudoviricetes sp.]